MKGIFNLTFNQSETEVAEVTACNHLTLDGMDALFNRRYLEQPALTTPETARYKNTINYFFLIVDDGQPLGFDLDSRDVKFSDIARFPNSYQNESSPYRPTDPVTGDITIYQKEGQGNTLNVLAVGLGFKEIGGDGSNDFVWSIAKVNNTTMVLPNYGTEKVGCWRMTYSYKVIFSGNVVPEITVNVGGESFTFYKDALGNEQTAGMLKNAGSITERLDFDIATFTVNGARFTPPSEFKEIKTTDARMRKFEITYTNKRSTNPVDITGFALMLSGNIFSYKLEHDKYIVLQPGKKFKITIAVGIEVDQPGGIVYDNLKFAPSPFYNSTLGSISEIVSYNASRTKVDKVVITGRAGLAGERVNTFVNELDDMYGIEIGDFPYQGVVNSELTKIEYFLQGVGTRPIYTLLGPNPTVIGIVAPNLSAADCGWRVEAGKVVFRINVPADITHMQVALDDGVWHDYPVTAGASNDLALAKRFIYNGWFFVRWKNNAVTGQINKYMGIFKSGALIVEPFYYYLMVNYNQTNNRKFYSTAGLGSAAYPASTYPALDSSNSKGSYTATATRGYHNANNGASSDYTGAWNNNSYTLKNDVLLFQSDLTLKACPEITTGTYTLNGNEAGLPWKFRATRPAVEDVAIAIPRTNIPRSPKLDLKAYPTVEVPSKVSLYGTLEARKAEIISLPGNESLYTASAPENGQLIEFNITDKLFNHLDYGIRYLNEAGTAPLNSAVVKFKGGSLDIPAAITDYVYNEETQTISFTTPDRAVRASIKQFNIEVFAFECVLGGVTSFYMSQPLNLTQRYELWLYNANNETWAEPYVMVDNEETDEKPTSTGPYDFPEWTNPGTSDIVADINGANGIFADVQRWVKFNFKVRINGNPTDQFITRNEHGIITSIAFNSGMERIIWNTGYRDDATTYGTIPGGNSLLGVTYMSTLDPPMVIDVWHEWAKYALIDEASFGRWNQGPAFVPYYGQTTGKFQKTEIVNGYIRNTYRLRYKPTKRPRICPMYHLDISSYSKDFRTAGIFIHAHDLLGSARYGTATGYNVSSFTPVIDGKTAKWDLTLDGSNKVIKARCFNDDLTSFTFDTANPTIGWKFDNYDEAIEGTEGAENIYHTLEFCLSKGIWDGNFMSFSHNDLYGDTPSNGKSDIISNGNSDAIFAVVYPYAPEPNFEDNIGGIVSTTSYWENNPYSNNNEIYRFRDAFAAYEDYNVFKVKMDDSVVYINGEKCTVTKESITLPFTPNVTQNFNNYVNDISNINGTITEPTLAPYTFEAYVITGNNYIVSNRKHPNVWQIDSNTSGNSNPIKMVFGRNKFTQDPYVMNPGLNSNNVYYGTGVFFGLYRKYWAVLTMILYNVPDTLLKMQVDLINPSELDVDETKSKYDNKLLHTLIMSIIDQYVRLDMETGILVLPADFDKPLENFIIIDGTPFTLKFNPGYATLLNGKKTPFQRDFVTPFIMITKSDDEEVYIAYDHLGGETYEGFTPGIHTLTFNFAAYDDLEYTWMQETVNDFKTNINNIAKWSLGTTLAALGYVEIRQVNYIVTDIGTGYKVDTNGMPFTILDPAATLPEFTLDYGPSFETIAPYDNNINVIGTINPYYIGMTDAVDDVFTITLDGIAPDVQGSYNMRPPPTEEGVIDIYDRTDPSLLKSVYYIWTEARFGLLFEIYPSNSNTYIFEDVASVDDFMDPVENYSGTRHVFAITATTPVDSASHRPFLNSNSRSLGNSYGLPISNMTNPTDRIQSVVNGDEIHSRFEIVIGKKPVTEEDFDPSIGPSFYEGMTITNILNLNPDTFGSGLPVGNDGEMMVIGSKGPGPIGPGPIGPIGPGPIGPIGPIGPGGDEGIIDYQESATLIPNYFQYPYTSFDVTVNGKAAVFKAPDPMYDARFGKLRLDSYLPYPKYMFADVSRVPAIRDIFDDGTLDPLGNIDIYYNPNFIGPGDVPNTENVIEEPTGEPGEPRVSVGKYLAKLTPADFTNTYDYTNIPTIICDELGVVIVYDSDRGDWYIYTGDLSMPYFIEFRYKHVYALDPNMAAPVLDSRLISGRDVSTDFSFLTMNNFKLFPNSIDPTKFDISWSNLVKRYNNSMDNLGYSHMGFQMTSNPNIEDHIPEFDALDDTFVKHPIKGVTIENLAVTINKVPAILDLTNYSETDKGNWPSMHYFVSEVAEDNVFPEVGSMGNFTAENIHGKIKYDVITGTWTLVSSADNLDITVGLVLLNNDENLETYVDRRSGGVIALAYTGDYKAAIGFKLRGLSTVTEEPTITPTHPALHNRFINFEQMRINRVIIPNYELFDMADFELLLDGETVIEPVITYDTHSVPVTYSWSIFEPAGITLRLDVVARNIYIDVADSDYDFTTSSEGLLPLNRETNLHENPITKFFFGSMHNTVQWNYKKLLDVTDVRPLFLNDENESRPYYDNMKSGWFGSVITQGTKKSVSAAFSLSHSGVFGMRGCKAEQVFYGWLPTGYEGDVRAVHGKRNYVLDANPAYPLIGMPNHPYELSLWLNEDSNNRPM